MLPLTFPSGLPFSSRSEPLWLSKCEECKFLERERPIVRAVPFADVSSAIQPTTFPGCFLLNNPIHDSVSIGGAETASSQLVGHHAEEHQSYL
jgi:hypothetical protein